MKRLTCCIGIVGCLTAGALLAQAPAIGAVEEERARKLMEHGATLMSSGNPREAQEALRNFTDVFTGYKGSSFADNALVAIARYHLDVSLDSAAAKTAVDTLLEKYRGSDSEPMGYLLNGRVKLMHGRSTDAVESALADFDRANRIGDADVLPVAIFYTADTLSLARRSGEAIQRYQQVITEYPGSEWAAKSSLGAARAFIQLEHTDRAMAILQRTRLTASGTPEAAQAMAWNTTLYRLHIRTAAQQPPYTQSARILAGPTGKLKDVIALGIDRHQTVYAVQSSGAAVFDGSGKIVKNMAALNATAIYFGPDGRPSLVKRNGIQPEDGPGVLLAIPKQGSTPRALEEIPAAVMASSRELLVTDREAKTIAKFTLAGKFSGVFNQTQAERLAVNWLDDVAALDRDTKSVAVIGHDGKQIHRIQSKGVNYELRNPVDVAYDALGYLYILDRSGERSAVYVFSPKGRLVLAYRGTAKTPGVFQEPVAFAVDAAGRLFIYDGRNERVQVYQ